MGYEPTPRLSSWEVYRFRSNARKIKRAVKKLRKTGELQEILDASTYTYLSPGSFQGDDSYYVYPKGDHRMEAIVYTDLDGNKALWWIVNQYRATKEASKQRDH